MSAFRNICGDCSKFNSECYCFAVDEQQNNPNICGCQHFKHRHVPSGAMNDADYDRLADLLAAKLAGKGVLIGAKGTAADERDTPKSDSVLAKYYIKHIEEFLPIEGPSICTAPFAANTEDELNFQVAKVLETILPGEFIQNGISVHSSEFCTWLPAGGDSSNDLKPDFFVAHRGCTVSKAATAMGNTNTGVPHKLLLDQVLYVFEGKMELSTGNIGVLVKYLLHLGNCQNVQQPVVGLVYNCTEFVCIEMDTSLGNVLRCIRGAWTGRGSLTFLRQFFTQQSLPELTQALIALCNAFSLDITDGNTSFLGKGLKGWVFKVRIAAKTEEQATTITKEELSVATSTSISISTSTSASMLSSSHRTDERSRYLALKIVLCTSNDEYDLFQIEFDRLRFAHSVAPSLVIAPYSHTSLQGGEFPHSTHTNNALRGGRMHSFYAGYLLSEVGQPLKKVRPYVGEIFKALYGLHKKCIIHGDPRVPNILLMPDGSLKWIDFRSSSSSSSTMTENNDNDKESSLTSSAFRNDLRILCRSVFGETADDRQLYSGYGASLDTLEEAGEAVVRMLCARWDIESC